MTSDQPGRESLLLQLDTHLRSQGYAQSTIEQYVPEARRFLQYLEGRNIALEAVEPVHVSRYLHCELQRYRRGHGCPPRSCTYWRLTHASCVHMFLRVINGRWPPIRSAATPQETIHAQLLQEYAHWLSKVRGMAAASIDVLCREAARFLSWLGDRVEPERLLHLTGGTIEAYLAFRAPSLCRRSQKSMAQYLCDFLRYLHSAARVHRDLAPFIVTPTLYALETIPSALRAEEVEAVVETTGGDHSAKGLRDYAILLLLSTYGLRQGEVTHLRLEDVDWRKETLTIRHSKTATESYLPLLEPVGDALLAYLRGGRPKTPVREVFVRAHAPYKPLSSLYELIQDRLKEANIRPAGKRGPHSFRHARAVSLLRADASLKQIGDILGHRCAASTMIYLKLATEALRDVALEIPQEVDLS